MPIAFKARRTRAATAPRLATSTLLNMSVTRRPRPHEMLSHAFGHAQLVDVEHADEVIASLVGPDHRLRRIHRRETPHVRPLPDAGESFFEAGVADADAVHDLRCELGAHEAHFGRRPCSDVVRM